MKNIKLIVSVIIILLSVFANKSFAQRIYSPNTVREITSARNYCQSATASNLRFRYRTCNTGSGSSSGIAITVRWYSNTVNSTTGGTILSTTVTNSSTSSNGNLYYLPSTTTIGITYYYCVITWTGAGSCNTSGILTSPVTSVTVGAAPAAIGGSSTVCIGSTTTLTNATAGGTWRSSSTSVASIGLNTGVVTGVGSGTTTISYRATCRSRATIVLTVSATPTVAAISGGTSNICVGSSTTLTNSTSGGVWSSNNTSIATVNGSGSVTGVASGTATISYTRTTCATVVATKVVTVTTTPASISGSTSTCNGYSLTYSNTVPFGTWSSSNTGVASINSNNGTITTVSAGTTRITYSTGCGTPATQVLTVNAGAAAITGTAFVCAGNTTSLSNAVAGGTWSSSNSAIATVNTTGDVTGVTAGTAVISYNNGACSAIRTVTVSTTPSAITGDNNACTGTNLTFSNSIAFGTWSSNNPGVATINTTSGIISPLTAGTTSITYNIGCGTNATKVLTVNNQPAAITGTTTVCASNNTTLSNSVSGGTWSSSNNAIGTVNSTTGIVRGIAEGNVTISYTNNICFSTINVSVSPLPNAGTITGISSICEDETTSFTSSGDDGTWSSTNTSVATIDAEGDFSANNAGTTTISYSTTNSCGTAATATTVTVNASTEAGVLSGTATVCPSATTTLSSTISGGTWSSTNSGVATVGTGGIVTGVAQGNTTISYVVTNGCGTDFATQVITVNPLPNAGTITGTATVCPLATTTLTNAQAGGVWTSSNTAIATVGTNGIVTGVAQGNATISYAVTNSCGTAYATQIVTVNPLPNAGTITGTATVCPAATTPLSNAQAGGVWTSSNSAIATVGTNGVVTGVAQGNATISYAVTNSCGTAYATQIVTVNPLLNAGTITGIATVCTSSTTTLSNAQADGIWSSSNNAIATVGTAGVVTGVSQGTATISYSITNSCGTVHATQVVTVDIFPNAGTITGIATICTTTTTTLNNAQAGGVWASSNNAIATVGTGGIVTGVAVGTVTISYSITNSCGTDYATLVVSVNAAPNAVTANATPNPICNGSSLALTSSANSNIVGGGTVCGTASENGTLTLTAPAGTVFTSVTFASYGTPTGSCGSFATGSCHAATSLSVVQSYLIGNSTATIPATNLVFGDPCSGTSKSLYVEANYSYSATYNWSGPNGFSSTTQNPTAFAVSSASAGIYTVTASNACGSASTTRAVTINPLPDVGSIIGTPVVCTSATTALTNTQPSGIWSSSNSAIATIGTSGVVTGVAYGSATISYAVTNSCGTDVATQVVTVNAVPSAVTATATPNPICSSSNLTLTSSAINKIFGGTVCGTANEGGSITLTAPAGAVFTGVSFASYGTPTGSCGSFTIGSCHSPTSLSVAESYLIGNSTATIPASNTVFGDPCTGTLKSLYVQAIYSYPADYQWSGPNGFSSTDQNPSAFAVTSANAGIYTFTATNICGTASATQVVTVNPLPNAGTITGTATVCPTATTTFSNAQAGGVWTSSNTAIATVGTNGVVTGVAQGNTTISYAVTNSCGTAYATQVVTVNPLPNAGSITGTATVCPSATTTLSNVQAGGVWTSSNTAIATVGTGGVVTGVAQGNTTISYAVTNSCGTAYATQVVTVNPLPNTGTITGTATVCPSATTNLTNAQAGGVWTSANTAIATVGTTGVVTGVAQGNATISYAVTNSCGTLYATQVVTVYALPNAGSITGATSTCVGTSITLSNVQPGGVWNSSNIAVATIDAGGDITATLAGTTTISYTVTNLNGCSAVATRVTTINPQPTITSPTTSFAVCQSGSLDLSTTVSGGVWSSSNTAAATIGAANGLVYGVAAGTTNITYNIAATGCSATVILTVNTAPTTISNPAPLCPGETATMTALPAGGTWTSNNPAVLAVNATTGEITAVINNYSSNSITFINYITANGCSGSRMVTVKRVPAPIYGGVRNMCTAETTTLLCGSTGNVWSSTTPAVATINTSGVVSSIAAGTTTISYTNTSGCANTTTITVNSTLPDNTGSNTVCTGQTTTLSNAIAGGTWSSSGTLATINTLTGVVTGINAGTVNISYRISAGCYSITQVTVNSNIQSISGTLTACEGTTTTLSYPATTGTWSSSNTAVATINPASGLVTGITSGTTTISYIMEVGCFKTAVVTVTAAPAAITGTAVLCQNATTTLSSAGGTWSSSNTTIAVVNASGQVTGISAGNANITYRLTATSCYTTREVTVNPLPVITPVSMCEGDTVTMVASPAGGTWTSNNASVAVLNSATGTITGVYLSHTSIGVAAINYVIPTGCANISIVTLNPTPAGIVSSTATVCAGNNITLTSSTSGATWSSNNTTVATVAPTGVVTGVNEGTATITYTFASGCSTSKTVSVNPIPTVNSTTGTLSICRYENTSLTNDTPGGTWTSSNPSIASISNAGVVNGNNDGTATITYAVANSYGCTNRTLVTITINPLPVVPAITGTTSICIGSTTNLTNANPDGVWTSSNTAIATIGTSGTVSGIAAGTASISYTVTSAFGCTTQVATIVTVSAAPIVAPITGNLNVCKFDNTNLANATPTGIWNSSTPAVASVNAGGIVTTLTVGTTTISYTVSNVLGCSTTVTKVVTVNEIPAISSPSGWDICEGATMTIISTITEGTWSSSDPAKATIGVVAGNIIGLSAGNTTITFTTNEAGCTATQNLLVKNSPTAITTVPALCKGNTTTLSSTPASGTWTSFNPSVVAVNASTGLITAIINNHSDISYTTITYTIPNGCSTSQVVTVNPHPADIFGTTLNLCAGQSTVALTGTTGGTWTSSNTSVATISVSGNITSIAAGTTTISYTNSFGCAETEIVTVNPVLAPNTGTTAVCSGTATTLSNVTSGGTWTSSNTSVASINITLGTVATTNPGTANITYTAPTGCKATSTITVNAIPATIAGTTTLCQGTTTTLTVTPATGTWSSANTAIATINETTGLLTAVAAGTTQVTYSNAGGCYRTATVTVNSLPADITGTAIVCAGGATTALTNASGSWYSSNTSVAAVNYIGTVTGINAGNTTITFRNAANCFTTRQVTVNPLPNTFTTPNNLCAGSTATLVGSPAGGTWLSSNNAVFTINTSTGDMNAVIVNYGSISLSVVTYTLPTGCKRTALVTVNPMPATIYGGSTNICTGNTTTFLCGTASATWSSSTPSIATINSSGVITGINSGTTTISYTNSYGCSNKRILTVNLSPADITGDNIVATGATITLSNATPGGTWTSNNTSKATIHNTTGVVSGISAGTANISYIMSTGCFKTKGISVVASKNEISLPETTTETSNNFSVYPNPTSGNINIATDIAGTFNIYTMDGKMIETREIKEATTSITLPGSLSAGYYVCQFIATDGTQKIVRIMYQP